MKKIIILISLIAVMFILAGCGSEELTDEEIGKAKLASLKEGKGNAFVGKARAAAACSRDCPSGWENDAMCDDGSRGSYDPSKNCNVASCNFDGGACEKDENACTCPSAWLGDKYCDSSSNSWASSFNCESDLCDFDGGDCPNPYGDSLDYYKSLDSELTQLMFDETIKRSIIVASDLLKFKHTFPDKEIDVDNQQKMFNTMYFGMDTKEEVSNFVNHLVYENVQKLLNLNFDLSAELEYKGGSVQNFGEGFNALIDDFEKGLIGKEDAFAGPGSGPGGEGGPSVSEVQATISSGNPCVNTPGINSPVKGADKMGEGSSDFDKTPGQAGDKTSATAGVDGDSCNGIDLAKMQGGGEQVGKSTEQKMAEKGWSKVSGTSYEGGYGYTDKSGYTYNNDVKIDFETFTNPATGDKQTLKTTTVKETVTNPQGEVIQSDKKVKQGDPKPVSGEPVNEELDENVKENDGTSQKVEVEKVPPKDASIGDPNADVSMPDQNPGCPSMNNAAQQCASAQFGKISNDLFGTGEGSECDQDTFVQGGTKGCGSKPNQDLSTVQLNFFTSATSPEGGAVDPVGMMGSFSGDTGKQATEAAGSFN
jgi:hypothetical protein